MKHNQIVKEVCYKCGKVFDLGYAGIYQRNETAPYEENPVCNTCARVERDADGNAWLPGDTELTWEDGTVTTRAEAFPGAN